MYPGSADIVPGNGTIPANIAEIDSIVPLFGTILAPCQSEVGAGRGSGGVGKTYAESGFGHWKDRRSFGILGKKCDICSIRYAYGYE